MCKAKDAQLRAKDAQLRAERGKVEELLRDVPVRQAQYSELQRRNAQLLRVAGVISVRGALEHMFERMGGSSEAQITAYFAAEPLGVAALTCINSSRTVLLDYYKRPLLPAQAAKALLHIMRRLSQEAHEKRTAAEYARDGDEIVMRADGVLSASDVELLACFFSTHAYPVRTEPAAAPDASAV